jgi:acyl carrier protein
MDIAGGPSGTLEQQQRELEAEVAALIAEAVNLDKPPQDLDPDCPLFGEGLSLDSIDALEIALAVSKRYGFQLRSDDEGSPDLLT